MKNLLKSISPPHLAATPSILSQEIGFRAWINSRAKHDVMAICGGSQKTMLLEDAFYNLLDSSELIGPAGSAAIGLTETDTIAAAAAHLLWAHTNPNGPRCRSFRSASLYLVGMAFLYPDEMRVDRIAEARAHASTASLPTPARPKTHRVFMSQDSAELPVHAPAATVPTLIGA
ncbi:MAG: hypothetical protein WD360_06195 [Nitriliruptoraceae bacterium]